MSISRKIRIFSIFSFFVLSLSLKGMEFTSKKDETSVVEKYKYRIWLDISLTVRCSPENKYGTEYLSNFSTENIPDNSPFSFLKKPFSGIPTDNHLLSPFVYEYTLKKKMTSLAEMTLSCICSIFTKGFDEKYYNQQPKESFNLSFLELAIIAMLREYKIDQAVNEIKSQHTHLLPAIPENYKEYPLLQEELRKFICRQLTANAAKKEDITQESELLKIRYFPKWLGLSLGQGIADALCKSELHGDTFLFFGLVNTIIDDQAAVNCDRFNITITEQKN